MCFVTEQSPCGTEEELHQVIISHCEWFDESEEVGSYFSCFLVFKNKLLKIVLCIVFRDIMPAVRKNKEQAKTNAAYNIVMGADMNEEEMIAANRRNADQMSNVIDIR